MARAAGRRFAPAGCSLDAAWTLGNGTRVFFWGDSLLRQVFIAAACRLHAAGRVVGTQVDWPACGTKEWPCHRSTNCVRCGPGSGFFSANVTLAGGAELRTVSTDAPGGAVAFFGDVRRGDVVVVEAGVHGWSPFATARRVLAAARPLLARAVRVVWVVTPQDAFLSRRGDGRFERAYLQAHRGGCLTSVAPSRSSEERRALRAESWALDGLWGVVDLAGLADQGDLKVGRGAGALGDCQHYCLPGPPDALAAALGTMLAALPG